MDTIYSNRPEPVTAIVAHELSRYNIDIAALSETRLAGTGDIAEVGACYTFFWSGRQPMNPGRPVLASPSAQISSPSLKPFQKESVTG